jgi:hypothetical protein
MQPSSILHQNRPQSCVEVQPLPLGPSSRPPANKRCRARSWAAALLSGSVLVGALSNGLAASSLADSPNGLAGAAEATTAYAPITLPDLSGDGVGELALLSLHPRQAWAAAPGPGPQAWT